MNKFKTLTMLTVIFVGLIMAWAMYFDKTNIILTFGFMLNALLITWSKK